MLTGKFERSVQVTNIDLNKYDLVSKYIKGSVLLKSKESIMNQKDDDYFFGWELLTDMK
jgi:hypothetical protein